MTGAYRTLLLLALLLLLAVAVRADGSSSDGEDDGDESSLPVVSARFNAKKKELVYEGKVYSLEAAPEGPLKFGTGTWWVSFLVSVACIVIAGLGAGLTMGLVSVDPFTLHVLLNSDEKDCKSEQEAKELATEKAFAAKILPLVSKHHLLLVTLLLANAGANETLPIFLDRLVPSWAAIVLAVTFVLVFGEILPSSVFTGPHRLRISAKLSGFVWVLMTLFAPIAWPIAKLLDRVMGEHELESLRRHELKAIVRMHGSQQPAGALEMAAKAAAKLCNKVERVRLGGLTDDEITIISGVLDSSAKQAQDLLIPLADVFMLSADTVLDEAAKSRIIDTGHSRIPVFQGSRSNIKGLLLTKKLMVVSPEDQRPVSQLPLRRPFCVLPTTPLFDLLNEFQLGKSHMAIVTDQPQVVDECMRAGTDIPASVDIQGVVCLEDVIELMIGEPIQDEFDTPASPTGAQRPRQQRSSSSSRNIAMRPLLAGNRQTVDGDVV
eukprot:TRINITY_DN8971_c0_g1_i1.p1 TRINITY_DN8971_c0_g1~~TRINITY_DN8971_c0_g1_i1.p1  ORF type:complete len:492 (+),score=101.56 TRINITY_DN8971_c0_g1_i1:129-1604(+)